MLAEPRHAPPLPLILSPSKDAGEGRGEGKSPEDLARAPQLGLMRLVLRETANRFRVSVPSLFSARRTTLLFRARILGMSICRDRLLHSPEEIGQVWKRGPNAVDAYCRKFPELRAAVPAVAEAERAIVVRCGIGDDWREAREEVRAALAEFPGAPLIRLAMRLDMSKRCLQEHLRVIAREDRKLARSPLPPAGEGSGVRGLPA